ncbi:Mrp/NBP35 family ATP-binding protein [Holophaga foetida]|uniref:Mrp/NBP35 family ATP-binding protein n=1 Tax=Holophaga foetida TaxID=35839 RepID=UPI0002475046|nr:Mrp/NBP35 family ATP-binding protein [Holophaga foetida]
MEPTPGTPNPCQGCARNDCPAQEPKPGETPEAFEERRAIQARLCRIRHTLLVLSGKGGVGKSTVAVNLAVALRDAGHRVGLLDVDVHGPSVPTMLGLEGFSISRGPDGLKPLSAGALKVMSVAFLLSGQDEALIWRGPMKMKLIKQFVRDVAWGDLDYLIVDAPPGTGDEPLTVCQVLSPQGAVVVTSPQRVAAVDVRKAVTFCRQLRVPILGVIENMSGFTCPRCGEQVAIFRKGGGRILAEEMGLPFLGELPLDPGIGEDADRGLPFVEHRPQEAPARAMEGIIGAILEQMAEQESRGSGF